MVQIRDMQPDDAVAVSELYSTSWRENYGSLYNDTGLDAEIAKRFSVELQMQEAADPDKITLVADGDGRVVGATLSFMDERNQAWLDRMHILPEFKGSGLADDLMRAMLTKHSGLQSIALKVLKGNDRAVAFYEKHGFVITDKLESDEKVGGAAALIMSRTIPRS